MTETRETEVLGSNLLFSYIFLCATVKLIRNKHYTRNLQKHTNF